MNFPEKAQCYCCEKIATTREYVPPQCFYPEDTELASNSPDDRREPITVPSCSEHNNARAKDNEYTAAVLVMNSESNLAFSVLKSKWVQSLLSQETVFDKSSFPRARSAKVFSTKNRLLISPNTLTISYEMNRIERVIESIARTLYYHESGYQEKWTGNCLLRSPKFLRESLTVPQDFKVWEQINQAFICTERFQQLSLQKGVHPEVFYYQFFQLMNETYLIKMVFYNDCPFLVVLYR